MLKLGYTPGPMWLVAFRMFLGMLAGSIVTNAVAVYLLHNVDADQIGTLNSAYWGLMLEFLVFATVVTAIFLLVTWAGSKAFRLPITNLNPRLDFVLGIAVVFIQYLAEFIVRKLNAQQTSENFLLAYLLLAPVFCAAMVLLGAYRRQPATEQAPHISQ